MGEERQDGAKPETALRRVLSGVRGRLPGGRDERSRLLSALVIVFFPCFVAVVLSIRYVVRPIDGWAHPPLMFAGLCALLLLFSLVLNRFGRFFAAASILIAVLVAAVFFANHLTLSGAMEPTFRRDDVNLLAYLVIPVIFAAALLPLRLLVTAVALTFVGVLLVPVWYDHVALVHILYGPLPYLVSVIALLMFLAWHLSRQAHQHISWLAESEERYRSLFEQSLDPVFVVARDGSIKDVNEAAVGLFGRERGDFLGLHVENLYATPSERARVIDAVERKGYLYEEPLKLRTKKGVILECLITIWPRRDPQGRTVEYQTVVRDVTEQLRTEEDRRLRGDLLELAFDPIVLVDPAGEIVYANEALSRLSGYSPQELLGMNIRTLNTPDTAEEVPSRIATMLREGGLDFETRWLCKDGSLVTVEVRTRTVESGGRALFLSVARDVTRRKQDEAQLRLRSELLDLTNDAVFLHDLEGRFLYVNEAAASARGYTRDQLMHMSLRDIAHFEDVGQFHDRIADLVAKGSLAFESHHRHKDGRLLPLDVRSRLIEMDGRPLVLSVARDIADRKRAEQELRQSERKYRELFEQSMDAVAVFSVDGTLLDANPAHMRLFGNTKEDVGRRVVPQHYVDPSDRDEFIRILKRDGVVVDQEIRLRKKDGTEMDCIRTAVAVSDEDGHVTRIQTVTRDITESKRIRDALMLTQRTVDRAVMRVFWIRPDGSFAYVNEEACRSLGYTREELLTMSVHDIDPNYPETDREKQWQRIRDMGALTYETIHVDRWGNAAPVEVTSNYFSSEGVELSLAFVRDISSRKRAAEELRRSEEKYRLLAENTLEVIWQMDLGLRFTYVNSRVEQLAGFTVEEWLCSTLAEHASPERFEEMKRVIEHELSHLNSHTGVVFETAMLHKDGREIPVEIRGTIIVDEDGKPVVLQGSTQDIAERKHAEQELRDREQRYRELFEQSLDAVALVAMDGTLLEANQACLDMFGWSADAIGRVNVEEAYVDPTERGAFLQRLDREERIADQEVNLRRTDGTELVCLRSAVARRDSSGRMIAVQVVVHDITAWKQTQRELQESELRFRSLVENAGVGILMTRLTGEILDCNDTARRMFGYARDEFLRLNVRQLYARDSDREQVLEAFHQQGFLRAEVIEFQRKDGGLLYVALTSARVPLRGECIVMSELLDVTEQRKAEEELRASRERLRLLTMYLEDARERERTGIARELHDQLGQALTALSMDLNSVTSRVEKGQPVSLDHLKEMSLLLDQTSGDVRRISSELRPGMLDDIGLVSALEWQLTQWAVRMGIEYDFLPEADDVNLDKARSTALFRVFQEVLTNVARHAGATHVHVSFLDKDGRAILTVEDNGRGITEDEIGHAESLGIVGMRERIRPLGGTLEIHGVPGKGTTVIASVPTGHL
mgnify:CR=1 FL=1